MSAAASARREPVPGPERPVRAANGSESGTIAMRPLPASVRPI